ncbi:PIR Superfamily Protein [Plasmodium ovale curtisi]|nr:PIR Superfamily Protein [Plasmodium ovale curtisi]
MERQKAPVKAIPGQDTLGQELEPGSREHGPGLLGIKGGTPDTESKQESSEIGKKLGHSVLGIAPVMLTATALYRYTPIGSWIRKLGGTNHNTISDIDEFSSYTQESGDMFPDNSANYISYQPM